MNGQSIRILAVTLALMGLASATLLYARHHQQLGQPGLRIVAEPIYDNDGNLAGTNSVYLPSTVLDYVSDPVPIPRIELDWLPEDTTYGRRIYRSADGMEMMMSAVLMGTDRTSIHQPQFCLTGQGLRIDKSELTSIRITDPHPYDLPVMKLTASGMVPARGGGTVPIRALFVYWFVADGQITADHLERMWWMARDLVFTGTLQRWAYVGCLAISAPGQEDATYQRMEQLIAAAVPRFQTVTLPPTPNPPPKRAVVERGG